uniref:Ribonuclease A-domain domain-containing protein n=1 Tax=Poecilia reticulata TaxID=8081 RepID=A0A3P9P9B7_POERE
MRNMLLCSLIVLLCMAAVFKETKGQTYEDFKKKHIINEVAKDETKYGNICTDEIKNRSIYKYNKDNEEKECKLVNTFIIDKELPVKDICTSTDQHTVEKYGITETYTCSNKKFDILVCTLTKGKLFSSGCQYGGKRRSTAFSFYASQIWNKLP